MPATLDDLAADLQQFFAQRFPLDGDDGPGSVLLVFDNLGRPLSAKEFLGADSGAAEDVLSHQRAADLADQLPAGNALRRGWYLSRGGSRLSRWYASVVQAAEGPSAASPDDAEVAAFEAAKAAALRSLEANKLAVVGGVILGGGHGTVPAAGTTDTFYATSMAPLGWYDEDSPDWNTYQVGAADQPAARPPAPVATPSFSLLVAEDPTVPELVTYVRYATETEPTQPDPPINASIPLWRLNATETEPTRPDLAINTGVARSRVELDDTVSPTAVNLSELTEINLPTPEVSTRLRRAMPLTKEITLAHESAVAVENAAHPFTAGQMAAATASAVVDATAPVTVTSSGFAVHFDYCLVRLDRPWWDDVFLHRPDWRLSGYPAGAISSGSAKSPDGEITLVTIGMLAIRNLTVTARWTPADLAALPRSTSLGPFCIAAGDFDQATGTLSRKGMQAIAWLCVVPPRMPPQS